MQLTKKQRHKKFLYLSKRREVQTEIARVQNKHSKQAVCLSWRKLYLEMFFIQNL